MSIGDRAVALPEFVSLIAYVGTPTLAFGTLAWRVSRAVLLQRAGATALKHGDEDPHGKAGLEIVKALTDEPWYKAVLPWRRPDDGSGP
jgi:hypothetical protein